MIDIINLNKSYGKNLILKDLSLSLQSGRITAIAGPNGSGKTTLIKSILGLIECQSGEIKIDNEIIKGKYLYRNKIGYMPQIGRYPENLTINEILRMMMELRGNTPSKKLSDLISIFSLDKYLENQMKTLSGGTKQKVSAIIAFMFAGEILILDEPTTGLDPHSSSKLKDLIIEEKKAGKTILLISHIMSEVDELADDLVYILEGKIRLNDNVENLKSISGEVSLERAISKLIVINDGNI